MVTPKISVLFPTVRPRQFQRSLDSIGPAAGRVSYEVVVVADFPMLNGEGPLLWLQRPRRGPIEAIHTAHQASCGEFLFVMNDESTLDIGALERLYVAALNDARCLYSPRHVPDFGFYYYGRPFAAFPFIHRCLLDDLGGFLFDPAYRGFYADPDLSMRAHAAGVPIRVVDDAVLRHANNMLAPYHQENLSNFLAADRALFRSRWDHLGEFQDP